MGIINNVGIDQVFVDVRKENPWLPHGALSENLRITDVVVSDGQATGTLSGRYGSGYSGFCEFKYRTLDLNKLFSGKALTVGVLEPKPLYDLFDDIFQYTGIKFGPGDIENCEAGPTLPYTVKLKAKPLSALYTGEIDVTFQKRDLRIDEIVISDDYSVEFRTFTPNATNRTRGEYLTYGVDYTAAVNVLKTLATGLLTKDRCDALVSAISPVDELPWTSSGNSFWSLLGNDVIYNGPVLAYDSVVPNLRFTHVVVVDMCVDTGTGDMFGSKLYLHYNILE